MKHAEFYDSIVRRVHGSDRWSWSPSYGGTYADWLVGDTYPSAKDAERAAVDAGYSPEILAAMSRRARR